MLSYATALLCALAYASDAVIGKLALEEMSTYAFVFVLCVCYTVLGIGMLVYDRRRIVPYLGRTRMRTIVLAVIAIVLGTIIADILMWYTISVSSRKNMSITISLIHTTPVFAMLLLVIFFKSRPNWKAIAGMMMTFVGCIVAIVNSDYNAIS